MCQSALPGKVHSQFCIASAGEAVAEPVRAAEGFSSPRGGQPHSFGIRPHGNMQDAAMKGDGLFQIRIQAGADQKSSRLPSLGVRKMDLAHCPTGEPVCGQPEKLIFRDAASFPAAGAALMLDPGDKSHIERRKSLDDRFRPLEVAEGFCTSLQCLASEGAQLGIQGRAADAGRKERVAGFSDVQLTQRVFQLADMRGFLFPARVRDAVVDSAQEVRFHMETVQLCHVFEVQGFFGETAQLVPGVFAIPRVGVGVQASGVGDGLAGRRGVFGRQREAGRVLFLVPAGAGTEDAGFCENAVDLIVHAAAHEHASGSGSGRNALLDVSYAGTSSVSGAMMWGLGAARLPRQDGKSARPTALRSWEHCSWRLPSYACLHLGEASPAFVPAQVAERADGRTRARQCRLVRSPWRARPFGWPLALYAARMVCKTMSDAFASGYEPFLFQKRKCVNRYSECIRIFFYAGAPYEK